MVEGLITRRKLFMASAVISAGMNSVIIYGGHATFDAWLPWRIMADAVWLPAAAPAFLLRHPFGIAIPSSWVALGVVIFWLFPIAQLCRLAGIYDPYKNKARPRPRFWLAAAGLLDEMDKLRFGSQKTGGWS